MEEKNSVGCTFEDENESSQIEPSINNNNNNWLKLSNGFLVMQDTGENLGSHFAGVNPTLFGTEDVNVYIRPSCSPGSKSSANHEGPLVIDRGVLLLQRSLTCERGSDGGEDVLSIRAFMRGKMDSTLPDVVIPIGSIVGAIKSKKISSSSGTLKKGRLVIRTSHSLNTLLTMQPMTITIKMSLVGMLSFLSVYADAVSKWPNQKLRVVEQE